MYHCNYHDHVLRLTNYSENLCAGKSGPITFRSVPLLDGIAGTEELLGCRVQLKTNVSVGHRSISSGSLGRLSGLPPSSSILHRLLLPACTCTCRCDQKKRRRKDRGSSIPDGREGLRCSNAAKWSQNWNLAFCMTIVLVHLEECFCLIFSGS